LLGGVSESLAGRALYLTLRPFSLRERLGQTAKLPFLVRFLRQPRLTGELAPARWPEASPVDEELILDGGMPPVALQEIASREL